MVVWRWHRSKWFGALGTSGLLSGCAGAPAGAQLHLNQVGYDSRAPKRAVVESELPVSHFEVLSSQGGRVVLQAPLHATQAAEGWDSKRFVYSADFSAVFEPGEYVLRVGSTQSSPFKVGDQLLFAATARDVVDYFRGMRASAPEVWRADSAVLVHGSSTRRDVRGGWYDASGDISKYLSHLSYANFLNPQQTPLVVWVLSWAAQQAPELLQKYDLLQATANEAAFGADFLVRMQDESGFFYTTVFDGWSGDLEARRLCAYSGQAGTLSEQYQAAFREGGGLSIAALARAARGVAGEYPTASYLAAAIKGFAHLTEHNLKYVDDGLENVIDDYSALLAATELFKSTREEQYRTAARARAQRLIGSLHPEGYFLADGKQRPFYHASDAGLPVVALSEYAGIEADSVGVSAALSAIEQHLKYLLRVTGAAPNPYGYARQHTSTAVSSFFIPHKNESGYWWQGENARLASLSAAARLGRRALSGQAGAACSESSISKSAMDRPTQAALSQFATDQVDWILGRNPVDVCMLEGFGDRNPEPYLGRSRFVGTLRGGIANGITSRESDERGFQWSKQTAPGYEWERWRWVEQWLPHSAWYFMAITLAASDAESSNP